MKKVVEFTDRKRIIDEAASWILKLESDDGFSHQDKERLFVWLDQSPAHREHFKRLAKTWGDANILTELAVPLNSAKQAKSTSFGVKSFALAASLFLTICVSSFLVFNDSAPTQENKTIATAVGNQKSINLADGSSLKLNTNSKLRIEYSEGFRDIHLLSGEAYFEVAKDSKRPFRVFAGKGRIRAIGTAFGVYLKESNEVDVAVSEGRVGVASVANFLNKSSAASSTAAKPTNALELAGSPDNTPKSLGMLRAGEVGSIVSEFDENAQPIQILKKLEQVTGTDVAKRVSWTDGVLIFAGESLEQVVEEISRYTDVNIEFASPDIKAIRIGGNFPVGETETMFSSLETNFGLQVTRLDRDRIVISGGKSFN